MRWSVRAIEMIALDERETGRPVQVLQIDND